MREAGPAPIIIFSLVKHGTLQSFVMCTYMKCDIQGSSSHLVDLFECACDVGSGLPPKNR